MFRIVLISAILALAAAQQGYYNRDPKTAAILSEQRYQQGDGKFGAAYTQEDGTDFKEETDADGTRRGSYSYIDPSGAKKTVSYTAGKHGFVASGDHLPVAPPAPPQPIPQAQYQPQSQYQGQPQYKAAPTYDRGDEANFDDGSYDERYNDPSFSGNNANTGYRAPAPVPQHQVYKPAPQPQYHQQPAAPQPQYHQQPAAPQPQYHQPAPQQHYQPAPQPAYNQYTTESPHRFQPPGKLSLNRTPDGFSYSFNKA